MATQTVKLRIMSKTTNDESITTNVQYINPQASDFVLKTFAQKLNALSSNTFVGVAKEMVIDITDAESISGGDVNG